MKVVLLAVTSINGKITNGQDPIIYKWTSREDQSIYFKKIRAAKLIIMGAKTYEAAKPVIKLKKGIQRIVLTRNPNKYAKERVGGQLIFSADQPKKILKEFKEIKEALV